LISDYAKGEPKAERLAFGRCIEYGAYAELKNAPAPGRAAVKNRLAQRLQSEEGLDMTLCAGALDLLEAALFGAPEVSSAGNEWVTVAEHREAGEKSDVLPLNTDPPVINMASQEDYKEKYEEKHREAETLKEKLAKTKNGLSAAIVLGIIVSAVSIVTGVQRYNSLESQHKSLQSSYDILLKNWGISITSINVGNWVESQWINKPGERLSAYAIRYLTPVIMYNSLVDKEITLYIKVINPDGSLNKSESSPSGYSYKTTGNISTGNNKTWDLPGWGNESQSNYISGNYRIEVWYEGACLGTVIVTLN
jgi:hypothetical protein